MAYALGLRIMPHLNLNPESECVKIQRLSGSSMKLTIISEIPRISIEFNYAQRAGGKCLNVKYKANTQLPSIKAN